MTTNQTIDGVPRDSVLLLVEFLADARAYHKVVIERCNDCVKSGESSEREEYGRIGYRTEKVEQVERLSEELRALLDAPVVESRNKCGVQMVDCPECAHQWDHFFNCGNRPVSQSQGKPWARITLQQVLKAYDYANCHPHKYLRGTTNWCAAVAHSLNAEQPAPVAVVLPERKRAHCTGAISDFRKWEEAQGWNACLDEVIRLNTKSK